jgi:ABC-type glycerol-3-phosphate transport system substrate-binding protein
MKQLKFLMLLVMIWTSAIGCSILQVADRESSSVNENGEIQLLVSTITGPVAEKLKADANAFVEIYPNVSIKFNEFDQKTYEEQAPRLFLSANKPDVAWYWLVTRTYSIIEAGAFEPIDDLYESEGWDQVLPASTLALFTYKDGKKYGVSDTTVWMPVLYYNKSAFLKAGVPIPSTMEQFYAAAPKLREAGFIPLVSGAGAANVAGHIFEGILSHHATSEEYEQLLNFSVNSATAKYDSQLFIEVFRQLQRMGRELFPRGIAGMQDNEARALFIKGKAAVYSQGSWAAGNAYLGRELPADFSLGTMFYPQMKEGIPGAVGIFPGNALWVVRGTGKEQWAKKFVAFAMSKVRHVELAKSGGLFPSRTDLTEEELAPLGEVQVTMYKQLKEYGTVNLWHHLAPVELNKIKNEVVQSVIDGSMSPEQAARKMQETFEKTLRKE